MQRERRELVGVARATRVGHGGRERVAHRLGGRIIGGVRNVPGAIVITRS